MEVRCERCKTEYDFDDTRVPEAGVVVQCTTCGHVFKVKKKAVLVTMPLQPGETTPVATAAPEPRQPSAPAVQREWKVRQPNGNHFTFRELTTLQKFIVERKVGRDDEISLAGTEHWKRLGNIPALAPFFTVVDEAHTRPQPEAPGFIDDQARSAPGAAARVLNTPAVYPPISVTSLPGPGSSQSEALAGNGAGPSLHRRESVPTIIVEEIGDNYSAEELKTGRGGWILILLTTVFLGGGAYFGYMYYWQPQQQRGQAAARESARAAQAKPERDRAAESARSKANENARANVAQQAKSEGETAAAKPPSAQDAGGSAKSFPEAAAKVEKKEAPNPQRTSQAELPRNFDNYMAHGYRYLENQSPQLALEAFAKAADLRPDRAEPFGGRGLALFKMGDLTQAEASFQEALKLNPYFGIAVIGLAKTYQAQGRKDKAADYYGKYLEILPDGPEANGAKLALKRLRQE